MSLPFLPYGAMPAQLHNFRTLVAQYRGYHFYHAGGLQGFFEAEVIGEKYYTGLTCRMFGWIGDTIGRLKLELYSLDIGYNIGLKIDGSKATVYDNQANQLTIIPKRNGENYSLEVPGYFTLALRFEQHSHIHVIFGEKEVIHRAQVPNFLDRRVACRFIPFGSVRRLSVHMSDEQGKGSSNVSLKPGRRMWRSKRKVFVVIECQIADTSLDLGISLLQDTGADVKATFRTSNLKQNDEAVIFVQDTLDGWVVGTSFSPDFTLVKGVSNEYMTFPILSTNCKVHRMRWEDQY